jgi:hypothetical protein
MKSYEDTNYESSRMISYLKIGHDHDLFLGRILIPIGRGRAAVK